MLTARTKTNSDRTETLAEHSLNVSKKTSEFCITHGLSSSGTLAGLVHDYGKANPEWQNKINKKAAPPNHSIFGAQLLEEYFGDSPLERISAQIIQNAVLAHHSGLIDQVSRNEPETFYLKIKNTGFTSWKSFFDECVSEDEIKRLTIESSLEVEVILRRINAISSVLGKNIPDNYLGILRSLLVRYLYSCLIDSDRSDAAAWDKDIELCEYTGSGKWDGYYRNLCRSLNEKTLHENASAKERSIYLYRKKISDECDAAAEKNRKICRLFVPTGGGKTLAGLRFALKYAANPDRNIKRLFYIIPYTTILEQTAKEIIKAIGDSEAVLQHYSSFIPEEISKENTDDTGESKYELAAERWNAPIVLTTQVQFLNAFYSGRSGAARRMHQLSDSVIIFDEIQTIPLNCLSLFNCALTMLTEFCNCTAVLCSATQPELSSLQYPVAEPEQLILPSQEMQNCFIRVEVVNMTDEKLNTLMIADLVDKNREGSVLVVLNTKDAVLNLYKELRSRNTPCLYHLSTSMCPAHRTEVFNRIRSKLKNKENVICISTNLIEAGVDISFGCVIRSLAGLDSIAQAAGRCNRHGERHGLGKLIIIDEKDSNITHLTDLQNSRKIAREILDVLRNDPESIENDLFSPTAIHNYYKQLYREISGEVNYKIEKKEAERVGLPDIGLNLTDILGANDRIRKDICCRNEEITGKQYLFQSFRAAGEIFRVIGDDTVSVIVPFGKGRKFYRKINDGKMNKSDFRKLTPYCVSMYFYKFKQLEKYIKKSERYGIYMLDRAAYNKNVGANIPYMPVERYIC